MRAYIAILLIQMMAWPACQLNHPAPVTPDYPPPTPFENPKDGGTDH